MTRSVLLLAVLAVGRGSTSAQEMPQQQPAAGIASTGHSAARISELQKKADSGDPEAQYALGNAYQDGNGVRKSYERAAIWYRKAADQGNAKAQNSLGVLYWVGDGVDKDKERAVEWYRKAARQGNANAMFNLGAAFYNGEGGVANQYQAYSWFLLSSRAGSTSGREAAKRSEAEQGPDAFNDACFTIGRMYEKGEDLPKNLSLAAAWYRKIADRGDARAQIALGNLALNGGDYAESLHWCELAANKKVPEGYFFLGNLYQHGLGVPRDSKKALGLYERSAKDLNSQAMQVLGSMYATGDGVKLDRSQAFMWFLLGASRGDKKAITDAIKLRSSMSEKEWDNALQKLLKRHFDTSQVEAILQRGSSAAAP